MIVAAGMSTIGGTWKPNFGESKIAYTYEPTPKYAM